MAHFETPRSTRFQIGILILMGLFLGLGNRAFAQDKQAKEEPVKQTVPLSGAGLFKDLLCGMPRQGCEGRRAGRVGVETRAGELDDAGEAARRFPDLYVQEVLRNGVKAPAHGDAEMPVWGPLFRSMDSDPAIMYVRKFGFRAW
jgi:hypothetical protein